MYPHAKIHPSNKIPSTWIPTVLQPCRHGACLRIRKDVERLPKHHLKCLSQDLIRKAEPAGIIAWISLCSCGIQLNSQWRVVASMTDPGACGRWGRQWGGMLDVN